MAITRQLLDFRRGDVARAELDPGYIRCQQLDDHLCHQLAGSQQSRAEEENEVKGLVDGDPQA